MNDTNTSNRWTNQSQNNVSLQLQIIIMNDTNLIFQDARSLGIKSDLFSNFYLKISLYLKTSNFS